MPEWGAETHIDRAAESAIYREAKRLAAMGLIKGEKEYTGKRARTVYSITEDGKEALREWLGTPVSPFSMDFEAILRIFVAPLGTKDQLIGTLNQVLADAREMLKFAGEVKQEFIDGINPTQDQVYIKSIAGRLLHKPPEHRRGMGGTKPRCSRDLGGSQSLRRKEQEGP